MELLFASTNLGKVKEVAAIIDLEGVKIITLDELEVDFTDVVETGDTFKENAYLKADYFAHLTNLPTLADDSGLVVSAMDGEPGVNSKRWYPGTDEERNKALLSKLENETNRQAKFVTVACYLHPQEEPKYFRGEINGEISKESAGTAGFGYDPIFIPEGYDKPFADLGMDIKNKLSHRAIAYQKCRKYLETQLE